MMFWRQLWAVLPDFLREIRAELQPEAIVARLDAWGSAPICICDLCESPANGAPGIAHCMACCAGTMIESYDHDCPVPEHQELAVAQWGPR